MTNPAQSLEAAIVAAGATKAPRITPADIEANIVGEHYFTAATAAGLPPVEGVDFVPPRAVSPLDLLTFCVLVLRNGFTVTGESACASPENFNADIGRRIARENAVAKVWPLMGYELRSKLASQPADFRDRVRAEKTELDAKATALSRFIGHSPIFTQLQPDEQERLKEQNDVMWQYSEILAARIDAFAG